MLTSRIVTVLPLALVVGCSSNSATSADCAPPRTEDPPEVAQTERAVASVHAVDNLQAAFKEAIAVAAPGVVSVYSTKTVTFRGPRNPFGSDPFFDFFFDTPRQSPHQYQQQGLGSGFLIDDEGHILTNNHVVEGADEVKVKLADDRELDAKVVGTDPPTDLALLQVDADDLEALELGDSDVVEVGDWVLAIGNPFGLPRTVSTGIVSAKGRANVGIVDYEDFIQTDAAVNPGNSGGPLVDLRGRVVGINTAIASRSGGNNGIAFAIPINMAKSVVDQLLGDGKVVRGHLGIMISDLSSEMAKSFGYEGTGGVLVQDVVEGEAADEAGVRHGDIITKLDGAAITSMSTFRSEVAKKRPGTTVRLQLWREGATKTVEAELKEAPSPRSEFSAGKPPKIGITLQDVTPQLRRQFDLRNGAGVLITAVLPGSPAARAGVRVGDFLEGVGSTKVESAAQALKLLRDADLSKGVRLRISRDGQGRFVLIKVK